MPARRGAAAFERAARLSAAGDPAVYVCCGLRRCPCARTPRFPCAPVAATPLDRFATPGGSQSRARLPAYHAQWTLGNHAPAKPRTASSPSPRAPVHVLSAVRPLVACAACTEAGEPLPRPARLLSVGRLEAEGRGQRMRAGQCAYCTDTTALRRSATLRRSTTRRNPSVCFIQDPKPVTAMKSTLFGTLLRLLRKI